MNVLPHYFAIPIISSLVIMNSLAAEKTLFDFHTRTNSAAWQVVNDDVMGGVSTCSFTVTNDVAIFRGEISLENNGGFASARSLPTRQDLANCDAFVIRVRGDGHRYKFAELHALSIEYNHSTIAAIHFNPGTDKTRGHLGSQLERKAETNLKLERDGDAFVVWGDKNRKALIAKETGPRFAWSDERQMHVSVLSAGDVKLQKYVAEQGPIVEDVFNGHSSMRYTDLTTTFMRVTLKSESTAEKRIAEWEKKGPIKKEFAGLYVRGT